VADRPKLQKAIAHSGLMSRRAAEDLIARGRVSVDGKRAEVGQRVDPETEEVAVDGHPIPIRPDTVTYLLYKPPGVISTADDPQGRQTVVDLVPSEPRVYPVGRLDADSEGLLLLTNDGKLADLVMHPRYGIHKTYVVMVDGEPGSWVDRLVGGVDLEDGPAAAVSGDRFLPGPDARRAGDGRGPQPGDQTHVRGSGQGGGSTYPDRGRPPHRQEPRPGRVASTRRVRGGLTLCRR